MKKFFVSILAIFYLTSSIGATIHLHYCMDKLIEWNLEHSKSDRCSTCGMSKKQIGKGCCKDEYKQLKLQGDQKTATSYQAIQLISIALPSAFLELPFLKLPSIAQGIPLSHGPPQNDGIPLYIRNKVFRI
jgi:hypothetical protein